MTLDDLTPAKKKKSKKSLLNTERLTCEYSARLPKDKPINTAI
jgi:hypothetical protein